MKKVLVTGGAGFIGSNLVRKLIEEDRQVMVIDNLSTGKIENLSPEVNFYEADLSQHSTIDLDSALEDVETIFHLGASASVIKSVEDPYFDIRNNVLGAINLLDSMSRSSCKRILFSSSSTVYGENQIPMHEQLVPNPISPYASGKLMVESLLKNYSKIHGIQPTMFRIFNAYGPFQDIDYSHQGITGFVIGRALKGESFRVDGEGDQERDYIFVEDVVEAFLKAEKNEKTIDEVINLGSGVSYSLLDLIKNIEIATGKKIPLAFGNPYRRGDVMKYQADTSKLNTILGISPSLDIQKNLEKTIEWAEWEISTSKSSNFFHS